MWGRIISMTRTLTRATRTIYRFRYLLALWKDYFVAIQRVTFHASFEQILESGMFGRLGEECIQLVDPFDEDKICGYFELWQSDPQKDRKSAKFFGMALSAVDFHGKARRWIDEVETTWLRHEWCYAKEKGISGIDQFDQIWLEWKPGENSGCMLTGDVFEWMDGSRAYNRQLFLNRDHS